ncbi:hypothetical protein [Catenulispora pinisilvae]|uniref:hypothetical protein n=1 Tax=Catenulispora pinisilvae TaxID=2705253 RepID=UPI001890F572|nr:hypothetical protein [Catenulispora pinisilvae]
MSIRNLGSWEALGLGSDPVHADPDEIASAQQRYQNIASTIDDAVSRLQKVMDDNSDGLVGQYIDGLRKSAGSLHDELQKAGVRYHDVTDQIKIYEPELQTGLDETAAALNDANNAAGQQKQATSMPDPQKGTDGTVTPQEQQKGTDKTNAENQANDALSAAKNRLNNALDQLNVAGKRFGDAVNSKNYHDGLTDTWKDKLDEILGWFSKILGYIGMALGALALLVPGLDVVVLAGVVVGAASLIVNSILYADGKGSVLDVIFGAVGLGLGFIGIGAAQLAKGLANDAKALAGLTGRPGAPQLGFADNTFGGDLNNIPLRPIGPAPSNMNDQFMIDPVTNAATKWDHMSDWYNNPVTNSALSWLGGKAGNLPGMLGFYGGKMGAVPEIGFWGSAGKQIGDAWNMWKGLGTNPLKSIADWAGVLGGWSGYKGLAGIMGAVGGKINPAWYVWGGFNAIFGLGIGISYTGGRESGLIPAVNP